MGKPNVTKEQERKSNGEKEEEGNKERERETDENPMQLLKR